MIEKPENVRIATVADEDGLYSLLIELHRHNDRGWGFPYRPEIVLERIETGTRPDPRTRTNPGDQRRAIIGVIDGPDGKICASTCLMLEPPVWFTDVFALMELWVYVRPSVRRGTLLYDDLFRFAKWAREYMETEIKREDPNYPYPVELFSGFMHRGKRLPAMERLWSAYGDKCGVLYLMRD